MEEETLLQETPVDNAMESGDAVPMAAPTPEPQAIQQDGSIQYMTYREDLAEQTAAEELSAWVAEYELRNKTAQAPAEQPVAEQQGATATEMVGAAAADVGRGVTEIPRAVFGGIRDAAQETINLFGDIGNWVEENVKTGGIKISRRGVEVVSFEELQKLREQGKDLYTAVELPEIGDPESTTGKAVKGISQFLAGFGAAGKILKAVKPATRAGAAGKAAARGAVADFTVFDPQEDRLSNLLQEVPELQNPVTEFLAADPTDTNAEGRFKNAIEGLGLGVAADGFLLGLKTLRQARAAKRAQEQAAEIARQAKITEVEAPATVSQKELSILGSDAPDAPLVGVAKARKPTKLEKAEAAVEGVTPTDIVDTAGAPRGTKDGEVFINFARINAAEDVQTVLQDMATRFKPDVEAAKRGKQTFNRLSLTQNRSTLGKRCRTVGVALR